MLHVGYKKIEQGPVVVQVEEVDFDGLVQLRPVIDRFNGFFHNVPIWGGQEWKILSVDEIVTIFRQAAVEIVKVYQQRHVEAVLAHSNYNAFVRWWKEKMENWVPPTIPSREMVIKDMVERCYELSRWMRRNQHRPFYSGSNMSHLINKPTEVAAKLTVTPTG
ncbi:MAG: hypothetical protein NUW02_02035 [Candidatus Campbellbacteria bacterium]|nr:hypothetical protein [Candidatus Campbellbacteria bacterium]